MTDLRFIGGTAILRDRLLAQAVVECSGGTIASIWGDSATGQETESSPNTNQANTVIDLQGGYLAPGFVDIHVHGGDGADFMDGTLESVQAASFAHLRHGTTTLFPTTTTGTSQQIHAMISACQEASRIRSGPNLPGIHLYGPFFAEDKVGCHSLAGRRAPTIEEYAPYFESNFVRIATCAAELPGASEFYDVAKRYDCFCTCGHSNASWSEMKMAFEHGMRHVDHFWCAMSSVPSLRSRFGVPMQASMTEFVLMTKEMSTEVIADGFHLSAELLEFAHQMIGPTRLCLVTDSNRALDMPEGLYRFGNSLDGTWLRSDGKVGWSEDGKSLASSVVGMDHMVRTMARNTSASLADVVRMASLTPAERTGMADRIGSIEIGKEADLIVLSPELEVQMVFVRGKLLWSKTKRND